MLTLFGLGTMAGTTVDANGVLHIVYDNTGPNSRILAHVAGGNGRAKLGSIVDADVPALGFSGVGSNEIGAVKLLGFDLIDGGLINLAGGVGTLQLNSIGSNTMVDVRSLPISAGTTNPSPTSPVETLQFVTTANGGTELAGFGGFTVPGSGSGASAQVNQNNVTTVVGAGGQVQVLSTGGAATSAKVPPPGVNVLVNQINGAPKNTPVLGPAQLFAYDPKANLLIRFDVNSGDPLQAIEVPGAGSSQAAVGLSRLDGRQIVLAAVGSTVYAYDVVTGVPVGSFTTTNLADQGVTSIDGIGETSSKTIIVDAEPDMPGTALVLDVSASLASGEAVTTGSAFEPGREFFLTGGATGVAGLATAYLTGAAHFDSFQPNQFQFGVLAVNAASDHLSETKRTQVTSPSSLSPVDPNNPQTEAFGSLDESLALVTGVSDGKNTITLYDPTTLSRQGSLTLNYGNPLAGLSESFHPELGGAAVINVRGITNLIRSQYVKGLVYNDIGYLNQIGIQTAVDSTFIGLPVGHVNINRRQNVEILSTARPHNDRGGVTVVPDLKPVGPLYLPTVGKPQ